MIFFISILSLLNYKYSEKDVIGIYTTYELENTKDTFIFKEKGIYNRKIYNKENKLLKNYLGDWKISNQRKILIDNFFLNLDRNLDKYPELLNDTMSEIITPIFRKDGKISFCTGYSDDFCFSKIN